MQRVGDILAFACILVRYLSLVLVFLLIDGSVWPCYAHVRGKERVCFYVREGKRACVCGGEMECVFVRGGVCEKEYGSVGVGSEGVWGREEREGVCMYM